mmetsp:Transcript_25165/g.32173  ORF Transcript_25165/g.32173 Transcript_25165/m.32173 type:complete len:88 (-) Transcript_25165:201-464(-)
MFEERIYPVEYEPKTLYHSSLTSSSTSWPDNPPKIHPVQPNVSSSPPTFEHDSTHHAYPFDRLDNLSDHSHEYESAYKIHNSNARMW